MTARHMEVFPDAVHLPYLSGRERMTGGNSATKVRAVRQTPRQMPVRPPLYAIPLEVSCFL